MVAERPRWNHNIHYHPLILAAAPADCARALDIGCGEGTLARELRGVAAHVTGVDLDAPSLQRARAQDSEGIDYVLGDALEHAFEPGSFDLVTSVAALHHMDAAAGLSRMAELVRPGGVVAVVGLARTRSLADLSCDFAGMFAHRFHRLRRGLWQHAAPTVWPPPHTYAQVAAVAARVLPGVRFRRHVLFRYSLIWTRPGRV